MVRIAGKLQRDQKCMSRTTFYFRHVIDNRYQAARELIENNGEKFDTCVWLENIYSLAWRRQEKIAMDSEKEAAIGGIQDFSVESPEQRVTKSFIEEELVLEEFTDELKAEA